MRTDKLPISFKSHSLDNYFGIEEVRTKNEYFGVSKMNMILFGSTTSGKTTYLLNLILQRIIPCNRIYIFAPTESLEIGLWNGFIQKSKAKSGENPEKKRVFVYNITKDKFPTYDDFLKAREKYNRETKPEDRKRDLFIFDDFIKVVDRGEMKYIQRLMTNTSRLSGDVILLMQSMELIGPQIIGNFQVVIIFFKSIADTQFEAVLKRLSVVSNRKQFNELQRFLLDEDLPYEPLIVINDSVPISRKLIFDNSYVSIPH